jgi:hypothetical protein
MKTIKKRNKKAVIILLTAFLLLPAIARAGFEITEIMYDLPGADTDREWIEVRNIGSSADITGYKFYDGSNHVLNVPPKNGGSGSMVIEKGGVFIIAANPLIFSSDNSNFNGTIVDTVMSLPNTAATIKILDKEGVELDSVNYSKDDGAAGDGNSLARSSGALSASLPTPGAVSDSAKNTDTNSTADVEEEEAVVGDIIVQKDIPSTFIVDAGGDRTVVSGSAVLFTGKSNSNGQQAIKRTKYVWNFGDGETGNGQVLMHTFLYPGRYAVHLYAHSGNNSDSDTITVKALESPITISDVSGGYSGYIGLKNNSNSDIDLSLWNLRAGVNTWSFPSGTYILKNTELKLPARKIPLQFSELGEIALLFATGEIADVWKKEIPQETKRPLATEAISEYAPLIYADEVPPPRGPSSRTDLVEEETYLEPDPELYLENSDQSYFSTETNSENKEGGKYGGVIENGVDRKFFNKDLLKWLIFLSGFIGLVIFFVFYIALLPARSPDANDAEGGKLDASEFEIEEELL